MKQTCCPLLLICLLAGGGCGQDDPPGDQVDPANPAVPYFHVAHPEVDAGEVLVGTTRAIEFEIANRGEAPLKIVEVISGCKCAAARLDRSTVPPHESAILRADVRVEHLGPRSATVTVRTNDPVDSMRTLEGTWVGVYGVEATPAEVDLGEFEPGSTAESAFTLNVRDELLPEGKRPTVSVVEAMNRFVKCVEADPHSDSVDGRRYVVKVTTDEVGVGRSYLALTFPPQDLMLRVPIKWRCRPLVESVPARAFVGVGGPDEPFRISLLIRGVGTEFQIDEVDTSSAECVTAASVVPAGDESALVNVEGQMPAQTGAFSGHIKVTCRVPQRREVTVPLSGVVQEL